MVAGETVATGAWWDPVMWADARAAYMFDLDHHPQAPAGFNRWLQWVLQAHVDRGPQGRAQAGVTARGQIPADVGLNRHHPLRAELRAALEREIVADRVEGRLHSRSTWIHEAVAVAVDDARHRAGGVLPPVPDGQRLPNVPVKAAQVVAATKLDRQR